LKTILFIDNYDSYRFLLQEEFLEEGFEIITAKNIKVSGGGLRAGEQVLWQAGRK